MKAAKATTSVDRMFRAFSDRTRLRILNLLKLGEFCVCDIVSIIGVPQAKASRHLGYLRRSGLVLARKEGLWVYYELAPAQSAFHHKLLECLGCCLKDVPELAADLARAQTIRCKDRTCCP